MKGKIQNMGEAEFTKSLKLKAVEILDTSVNKVLEAWKKLTMLF